MQDPTDSDTMQITCKSVPISVGYEHNSCANRSSPSLTRECLMILPETSVGFIEWSLFIDTQLDTGEVGVML